MNAGRRSHLGELIEHMLSCNAVVHLPLRVRAHAPERQQHVNNGLASAAAASDKARAQSDKVKLLSGTLAHLCMRNVEECSRTQRAHNYNGCC